MAMLPSHGSTGTLLMKVAPAGTPYFDVDAPAAGMHGQCTTCHVKPQELVHPLNPSGAGAAAVASILRGYSNTSTP